jgi:hypothetical protein
MWKNSVELEIFVKYAYGSSGLCKIMCMQTNIPAHMALMLENVFSS